MIVSLFVLGIFTLPSESRHRAKVKEELARHDMGRILKEIHMHREATGEQFTKEQYINDNYDVLILDYKVFSLGKVRNKETGKEAIVSFAGFSFIYVKEM